MHFELFGCHESRTLLKADHIEIRQSGFCLDGTRRHLQVAEFVQKVLGLRLTWARKIALTEYNRLRVAK